MVAAPVPATFTSVHCAWGVWGIGVAAYQDEGALALGARALSGRGACTACRRPSLLSNTLPLPPPHPSCKHRITSVYGAPEWRVGQGQTRQPKSGDLWALGATILEILFDQAINVTWTEADYQGVRRGVAHISRCQLWFTSTAVVAPRPTTRLQS